MAAIGSMRGSKLSSREAALLAGELQKPSWESRNEGIHERVSFEDSIWGFDLAGGAYYKTPLRVTAVKRDSRADKAGIRPGDKLLRINDIDTSTLTIQEAHEIIIESGIHIRLAVSSPDDIEDSYHSYQDPVEEIAEMERQRKAEKEAERWSRIQSKFKQTHWSLQWPWVSKRRVIYKESNCFMVPSKYEDRHRDKFSGFKQKEENLELFSSQTHTSTGERKQLLFPKILNTNEKTNDAAESKEGSVSSDKCISNGSKKEIGNMDIRNDNTVDNNQRNNNAVSGNDDKNMIDSDEVNEELNEVINKEVEGETDDVNENENIIDEDEEFDEWDPNDNEDHDENEGYMEEIFNEEEEINEDEQNEVIDDVLKDDANDIEPSTLEIEI